MQDPGASPMNESTLGLESELRISPRPVLAVLVVLGVGLYFAAEMLLFPRETVEQAISLFLLLSALSVAGWILVDWNPMLGRWFTILALATAVHLGGWWLQIPGSLAWAVVPIALAAPLAGLAAAVATAVGESAVILGLMSTSPLAVGLSDVVVALVAIWCVLGAIFAMDRQIHRRGAWYVNYFARAQRTLWDAQDRRAELKQALDDLTHANRQLVLMNERVAALRAIAEEAQKAKTTFVAKVSHEFRTPLNMIVGLVDLMVETPEIYDVTLSPRMREALQVVHRNSQHLSDMVNDILDLTRIETDRVVLHRERVDISEVVDSAAEAVRPLLESKQLLFSVAVAPDTPEVYCDRTRIEQVILNLVSNAARYTEHGKITVQIVQQDSRVRVSVIDTGPGILPEDLERIFEPFCQGTSDLWRHKGGSGLGLSISRQFIELHGGRMWVESELGVGTTLAFELPISPSIAPIARPGHQIREDWVWRQRWSRPSFPDSHYNPRFVVCDETGSLCVSLARYSDEVELVDARDLAQLAQALQESPAHAILFNAAAPEDTLTLAEAIGHESPGTPIIGCCVPTRVERAVSLGALGHLVKPVTRADLERAIQATGRPVRRVLLVDDDPDALALFCQMLHVCDSAMEVVTASGGQEALQQLRRAPPDLMLLDIVMPDIDGWQVLASMRQDEEIPEVATFVISAQDPADHPLRSRFLLTTMSEGLSLSKLFRCSLEISRLLLEPEGALDPVPGRTREAARA
jgi:signal transduction histidine kinase/CheY-like chemotaxis protein